MSEKKIARSIYFTPGIDAMLSERISITQRNRSVEAERLIRKGLAYEQLQNEHAISLAEPKKKILD